MFDGVMEGWYGKLGLFDWFLANFWILLLNWVSFVLIIWSYIGDECDNSELPNHNFNIQMLLQIIEKINNLDVYP